MTQQAYGVMSETIHFLMEIDKLKQVQRRTRIIGQDGYENSAEHSWHLAVSAMSLAPYAPEGVDIQRVVMMALLHDIVEIDVGDVLVYDLAARDAIAEKEAIAAQRLFGLLPAAQGEKFLSLWEEYEAGNTADARFAGALDRILPVIMNLYDEGRAWLEHDISLDQVLSRMTQAAQEMPELWQYVERQLYLAQEKGWLR